jgi:hypothetical protein
MGTKKNTEIDADFEYVEKVAKKFLRKNYLKIKEF